MDSNIEYAKELESYENLAIQTFRDHPILLKLDSLSESQIKEILIQKRTTSEHFKGFLIQAIRKMKNEDAKLIARSILNEEYLPIEHEQLLMQDLHKLGISKEHIFKKPSEKTNESVERFYSLVDDGDHYDIKALIALRVAGEVLVGEEYSILVPMLEKKFGLTKENSVFYWPHFAHDKKSSTMLEGGQNHSDRFGKIITTLVDSKEKLESAKRYMDDCLKFRSGFYDQFRDYL